jgi:GntR family transcriptional regulator
VKCIDTLIRGDFLNITLDKKNGLPFYLQLKQQLKSTIQNGLIRGQKLPSVRKLAKDFGLSVNTVVRAYEGLRNEGIITGAVGRGTFVNTTPQSLKKQNRDVLLRRLIEHAVEEALSLEYSIEDFRTAVDGYIREKTEMMHKVKLVFIECNIEQVFHFTEHLELDPHIHRIPVLLKDLISENRTVLHQLAESDIIVTSFYHLDEVRDLLAHLDKPIVGVSLEPEINTIIRIAKIPEKSTVGLVTTSEAFQKIIREVLDELHFSFHRILATHTSDNNAIRRIVHQCDAVLVSPKQRTAVQDIVEEGTEIIEFVFTPDRTSINNLKVALLELKKSKTV